MTYRIYTFSNRGPETLVARSLERFGVDCVTLTPSPGEWRFTHKIDLAIEALVQEQCEYVIVTDAFDVLFLDHPDIVIERYQAMNCPLLLNADKCMWPRSVDLDMQLKAIYDTLSDSPFRYLNSGCFVGDTAFVLEFLRAAQAAPAHAVRPGDDQGKIHQIYKEFHDRGARLDYRCEVFQVLNRVRGDELERREGLTLHNRVFRTSPIVVHVNKLGRTSVFAELQQHMFGEPYHG